MRQRSQETGSDPDADKGRTVFLHSYLLMPEIQRDYGIWKPAKVKIGLSPIKQNNSATGRGKDLKSKTATRSRNTEARRRRKKQGRTHKRRAEKSDSDTERGTKYDDNCTKRKVKEAISNI